MIRFTDFVPSVSPPKTTGGNHYRLFGANGFPWDPHEWFRDTGIPLPRNLEEVAAACEQVGYCPASEITDAGFTIDAALMVLRNFLVRKRENERAARKATAAPLLSKKVPKRRRRPPLARKVRPLTPKQTEAVQIVGECKGSFADAARRMGLDRKTVRQHYYAGMKKMGRAIGKKPKTERLSQDSRGQATVSQDRRRG
jgi:predicted DNA-binding protein (UPF0251 family)